MKPLRNITASLFAVLLLSGCMGALFNRVSLTSNRHVTLGQELMDLQEAHEKGIISDTEYADMKKDVLSFATQMGSFNITDKK